MSAKKDGVGKTRPKAVLSSMNDALGGSVSREYPTKHRQIPKKSNRNLTTPKLENEQKFQLQVIL